MDIHTQKFKVRLGLFIAIGTALFILAIFVIGKQQNLFNPVFKLTTSFHNVSGLQVGNNIRFSGIIVGTVDNIVIINDTTVKVDMMIKKDVWQFIKSDCKVTLGSEGIIGDKLLIIIPGSTDAPLAKENQHLASIETIEASAIMARLDLTTQNAEIISKQLSEISFEINMGKGTLNRLIRDSILAVNLNQTIANLNRFSKGLIGSDVIVASLKVTASNAENISQQLKIVMKKINNGDGTLGRLIQDTTIAENLNQSVINIRKGSKALIRSDSILARLSETTKNAESISLELSEIVYFINNGNGTLGRLIKDTILAENFNQTLINLKKSSKGLDENMNAAKHNFLLRGYYKNKEKEAEQKAKEEINE